MPLSLDEWLELLESRHHKTIDLGLERCREVWRQMGSPRPASKLFTVAGTNGKGSTVAYLCAMLQGLGYSNGSYTTPHLLHYNERVQINGMCARNEQLLAAFERVESARGNVSLTYFEFGTLAAIDIMSREQLDFAVLEVGLGGRLDAVNILDADCAVITPVGLDHQEYLGDNRETIGREKAGIIRPRTPLICGEADPPDSVLAVAASEQAPLCRLGREFDVRLEGNTVDFIKGSLAWSLPVPRMSGEHQVNNMATAVAAMLELVPESAHRMQVMARSLEAVTVPGRLQQVSAGPLVLVDVGHNPLAAGAVAQAISRVAKNRPEMKCFCVIGMLMDKDAELVATILEPMVSAWYCAGLPGERGQSGAQLAGRVGAVLEDGQITACHDVNEALDLAVEECGPADCILVFGSFLSAAAALARWERAEENKLSVISPASET